jgi:hypothetical protein
MARRDRNAMPSLTLPVPSHAQQAMQEPSSDDERHNIDTPTPPPYSPITPIMSKAMLSLPGSGSGGLSHLHASRLPRPPEPVPISESTNPDAIALRAAISVLQIQRRRALQDLETLQKQKEAALADPEKFAEDLLAGKIKAAPQRGPYDWAETPEESDQAEYRPASEPASEFGTIPGRQKVLQTPAINWSQYHILGEPLEALHEEQLARPSPGGPSRDERQP